MAGSALSTAYYDIFYILIGMGSAMNIIVRTATKAKDTQKFRASDPMAPTLAGDLNGPEAATARFN